MKDKKRVAPYFRFSNLLRIPRFYSSAHSCLHHSLWNSFVLQFLPSLFGNMFFSSSFLFNSSLAEIRNGIIVRLAGRSVPGGLFEHSEIWQMWLQRCVCVCVLTSTRRKESFACQGDKTSCSFYLDLVAWLLPAWLSLSLGCLLVISFPCMLNSILCC